MFNPRMLDAISPEYKRLRSEYRELDLEINQIAHYREQPQIQCRDERRERLQTLKVERQRLSNKISQLKGMLERTIILQHAVRK